MGAPAPELMRELEALGESLSRAGLSGRETYVLRATSAYLIEHAEEAIPLSPNEPLRPEELEALAAAGIVAEGEIDDAPMLDVVARHAALVASAIPLAEAARRLDVNPSRLRQRLQEGSLVGVRDPGGRSWLVPAFQFTSEGELPGLRTALKGIRKDARPVEIDSFFETPQPDLEDEEGGAMTPLAWLRRSGDPEIVRGLAQGI